MHLISYSLRLPLSGDCGRYSYCPAQRVYSFHFQSTSHTTGLEAPLRVFPLQVGTPTVRVLPRQS